MNARDSWSRHQRKCLQEYQQANQLDAKDLQVAFPGSMLFNQLLLIDESRSYSCESVTLSSLDVVFRYCGLMASGVESKELLIVCDSVVGLSGIDHYINKFYGIDSINVLSVVPDKIVKHLSEKNPGILVNALHPDWGNIDALYKLYREAKHSVFVDSMLVMDAAFTGNSCTLITSDSFRQELSFEYMQWNLQKVGCNTVDSHGVALRQVTAERYPFLVVGNSALEIEQGMAIIADQDQPRTGVHIASKLKQAQRKSADEVIILPQQSVHDPLARLRLRKSRLARKLTKLRKDPLAFLEDSNNALLKYLARLFSRQST